MTLEPLGDPVRVDGPPVGVDEDPVAVVVVATEREPLGELRDVFADADALPTATLLERLHKLDEAPWGDLRGKPLDPRRLSRMLRQYEVASTNVKTGDGRVLKGYRREDLHDAWIRYLPHGSPPSATSATSATPQVSASKSVADGSGGSATAVVSATHETPSDQPGSAGSGGSGHAETGRDDDAAGIEEQVAFVADWNADARRRAQERP